MVLARGQNPVAKATETGTMTTLTAKMAIPGATLAFVFGAATLPGATHIGAHASAGRAISIEPEAGNSRTRTRQPGSRGGV